MAASQVFVPLLQLGRPEGQQGEMFCRPLIPTELLPWALKTFASDWVFTVDQLVSKYAPSLTHWAQRSGKIMVKFDQISTRDEARCFQHHNLSVPKSVVLNQAWKTWTKKQQLAFATGCPIEKTSGVFAGWVEQPDKLFWIYRSEQETTPIFFNENHFVCINLDQNQIILKPNVVEL